MAKKYRWQTRHEDAVEEPSNDRWPKGFKPDDSIHGTWVPFSAYGTPQVNGMIDHTVVWRRLLVREPAE